MAQISKSERSRRLVKSLLDKFGGLHKVAEECGLSHMTIQYFIKKKLYKGLENSLSYRSASLIRKWAKSKGIKIALGELNSSFNDE